MDVHARVAARYVALAEALREPSELRSHYDAQDPRLAGYLREAMLAYANFSDGLMAFPLAH